MCVVGRVGEWCRHLGKWANAAFLRTCLHTGLRSWEDTVEKRKNEKIKGKQTAEKSENKTCYFDSALCSCQLVEDILINSRISQVLTCKRRFFQIWWHEKEKENWTTEKLNTQGLINQELAQKGMKTSAGFFEGIKPIPLGFSCIRSCSQFSLWEWSRKKMTSPILVMNFYSRLNCKYVNLIPRWSPKYMYHQTIDPDT